MRKVLVVSFALAVLTSPYSSSYTQDSRYRVLVVPMQSGALDKKFGEEVAKAIRERLNHFSTHAPISEREFRRALKQYEVKQDELNAVKSRQLANLMGARVAYYGELVPAGSGFEATGVFISVMTGDEVQVPPITVRKKSDASVQAIADAAIAAFEKAVRLGRAVTFCADYVSRDQPENALRNCNEALAMKSGSIPVLFNKALAFRQLLERDNGARAWGDSALYYFEKVLDLQPDHFDAVRNVAYLLELRGDSAQSRALYRRFLEGNPADVPVRLRVAYDLVAPVCLPSPPSSECLDRMKEAVALLEEGLEYTPYSADLRESLGEFRNQYEELLERTQVSQRAVLDTGNVVTGSGIGEFSPEVIRANIRRHCASKWPDDFQMQVHCVEEATEAVNELAELQRDHRAVPDDVWSRIFAKCLTDWTPWPDGRGDQDTYDFRMVAYCAQQQVGAYLKLHPR